MQKLYLQISEGIPDLPPAVNREKNIIISPIKEILPAPEANMNKALTAYLMDRDFIVKNSEHITSHRFAPGSILLWNPDGDRDSAVNVVNAESAVSKIPDDLIYQEINSFADERQLLRIIRNLYRALFLENELSRKEEMLKIKNKENKELLEVGIALSAERDNDKLLDLILGRIRGITVSDAGSLYLINTDAKTGQKSLLFKIAQNDSNPADFSEFSMPLNKKSIGGYVALTGEVLNIKDAYLIPGNREYSFNKSYDDKTGYRTKSMLTVPMKDHKDTIIGAIQLINRKKDTVGCISSKETARKMVLPFNKENESLVLSLASQAAVSLENNMLYQEIEDLFEGFVRASVTAIESRDPTTSGHSNRVALYTVGLAEAVNRYGSGIYRKVIFSVEEIKEIRYASLLHDFGKVGVREHVLVKAKKLYPHQLEQIKMRFAYIQKAVELSVMKERFNFLLSEGKEAYSAKIDYFENRVKKRLAEIDNYLTTIIAVNEPSVMAEVPSKLIEKIRFESWVDQQGTEFPLLTDDEYIKLRMKKGSLDDDERLEIESHVTHSYQFLKTIPWTKEMKKIPVIAYGHHEKLNGAGYPRSLVEEEIPIQTRMMTIADIYDALTAMDRPYKKAVTKVRALDILRYEVEDNHIDPELLRIFIDARIFKKIRDS